MKHTEYDSPFELVVSDITAKMAKNVEEMCWEAVQRVGINVDKEKLLIALKQDGERYREAYANGYNAGYKKREDDIVRCKDCKHYRKDTCSAEAGMAFPPPDNWYCADGERRETE